MRDNKRNFKAYIFVLLILSLPGCSLILTRPTEPVLEHTIRFKGETLPLLSSWYTGSERNATTIKNFNDLKTAKLKVGQEVWIPKRLLIRSKILPKTYLVSVPPRNDFKSALVKNPSEFIAPMPPKKSPLDLVQASRSSIIGKSTPISEGIVRQSKSHEWIREELERDSIQEGIIAKRAANKAQ